VTANEIQMLGNRDGGGRDGGSRDEAPAKRTKRTKPTDAARDAADDLPF
jgi:hypothetical protein